MAQSNNESAISCLDIIASLSLAGDLAHMS
jgi:hypothetical protein